MAIQTGGINYGNISRTVANPRTGTVQRPLGSAADESISTLHLEMRIRADLGGQTFDFHSAVEGCGSACRMTPSNEVDVLRFAKEGAIDSHPLSAPERGHPSNRPEPEQQAMRWLVTMAEGTSMVGSLTAPPSADRTVKLVLNGRMLIQIQSPVGVGSMRLLSRKEPIFIGDINQWPPRGATLALANGPIEYFLDDEVERTSAQPFLRVISNTFVFGNDPVSLLAIRPEISELRYVDENRNVWIEGTKVGGVALAWTDTRTLVSPLDPPVRYYHVYRRFENDDLNGWVLVRALPADITAWLDPTPTGKTGVEYVVLHAAEYPFGYRYESLVGTSVMLPAAT